MTTYRELLEEVQKLSPEEQDQMLVTLQELARKRRRFDGKHSPMEMFGLGEEVWRDPDTGELIDAQEYVNQERASWD